MREDLLNSILDVFERSAIGFNRIVPTAVHSANVSYPPFNVIKDGEGKFIIEMALAGFSKDNISVTKSGNFLTVEGDKEQEDKNYLFHGIAARHFKREIPVANGVEVKSAEMKDGILSIVLENKESASKQIPVL